MVTIHWDFTDGTELSYKEGLKKRNGFTTCCLDFFTFDFPADNVIVVCKDGKYISRNELLMSDNPYILKHITFEHNIRKMLVAGSFNWVIPQNQKV